MGDFLIGVGLGWWVMFILTCFLTVPDHIVEELKIDHADQLDTMEKSYRESLIHYGIGYYDPKTGEFKVKTREVPNG